jgi:Rv2525c-like, glycoside hydrolase-like domain
MPPVLAIAAALLLAGCYPPPAPPLPQAAAPRSVMPGQGVDLATDSSDVLNELKASGVEFVARYYREPQSRWPALSASEAQRLSSRGLKIVAVWESRSRDPGHFSYFSGYRDALTAAAEAQAIGQPSGSAIYFAVDYNAPRRSFEFIDDYFRGVGAGLAAGGGGSAHYAVGVYGSGAVCAAVKGARLARYTWLSNSTAWRGSGDYADWNIMQGGPSAELSFSHDSDEAKEEYGAFQVANNRAAPAGVFAQPQFPPADAWMTSVALP